MKPRTRWSFAMSSPTNASFDKLAPASDDAAATGSWLFPGRVVISVPTLPVSRLLFPRVLHGSDLERLRRQLPHAPSTCSYLGQPAMIGEQNRRISISSPSQRHEAMRKRMAVSRNAD